MEVVTGSQDCYICWKTFDGGIKMFPCTPKHLDCYSKFLETVPYYQEDVHLCLPLLCSNCFSRMDALSLVNEELEVLQEKISATIKSFSVEILESRNVILKNGPEEVAQNSMNLKLGIGSHFILPSYGQTSFQNVVTQYYDNEYCDYEDQFDQDHDSLSTEAFTEDAHLGDFLDIEITEPTPTPTPTSIQVNRPPRTYKSAARKKVPKFKGNDLLVVVERLRFDAKGKPIIPKPTKCKAGPARFKNSNRLKAVKLGKPVKIAPVTSFLSVSEQIISSKPGPSSSKRKRQTLPPTTKPPSKVISKSVPIISAVANSPKEASKSISVPKQEVKKFSCKYPGCGKSYTHARHLKEHVSVHANGMKFICTWPGCDRGFQRSDKMKRHYRIHTGEKPYQCSVCLLSFARSEYLPKHMKTCHSELYRQQQYGQLEN